MGSPISPEYPAFYHLHNVIRASHPMLVPGGGPVPPTTVPTELSPFMVITMDEGEEINSDNKELATLSTHVLMMTPATLSTNALTMPTPPSRVRTREEEARVDNLVGHNMTTEDTIAYDAPQAAWAAWLTLHTLPNNVQVIVEGPHVGRANHQKKLS